MKVECVSVYGEFLGESQRNALAGEPLDSFCVVLPDSGRFPPPLPRTFCRRLLRIPPRAEESAICCRAAVCAISRVIDRPDSQWEEPERVGLDALSNQRASSWRRRKPGRAKAAVVHKLFFPTVSWVERRGSFDRMKHTSPFFLQPGAVSFHF